MNNYKIKVNNESESCEAQELFFELGYEWRSCGKTINKLADNYDLCTEHGFICITYHFNRNTGKEITLQQLRDLVVLKRNKIEDATHECMGDKFLVQENRRYEWTFSGWATSGIAMSKLKPISEQQMASHNIEQQELQANPKLFLDPTQNYAEIEWDGSFMKQDHWVEVPDSAVEARMNGSGGINFINANEDYMNDATGGEWVGTHRGKHDIVGHTIVWQRTQDEPFFTPESVVEREVNHKNVVQKANEFSERLKKLEYQFEVTGSSASGSIKPQDEAQQLLEKYPHYYKDVRNLSVIDVYEVLSLFNVTDQAVGHTLKKLLVTGKRGAGKDYLQDLIEARDTLNRAIEICERKN